MALGAGSIAFTGFNSDGGDTLAFVALETVAAGTVIFFNDNEWTGSAFNTGESSWSWTAAADVAAGTIIAFDNIGSGTLTTSPAALGTVTQPVGGRGIANSGEIVYAYLGTSATQPTTFLAAIANGTFEVSGATLTGTGLTSGQSALAFGNDLDIAAFSAARDNQTSFAAYAPVINNAANWQSQDATGDQSLDGTAPDVPFSSAAFAVAAAAAQVVSFATGSTAISQNEGNAGQTTFTFTVERTGGTTGAVAVSGSFQASTTDAADFGGAVPSVFPITIPAGQASASVTVSVSADTVVEPNETFGLTLTGAANSDGIATSIGAASGATGVIVTDDVTPVSAIGGIAIFDEAPSLQGKAGTPVATDAVVLERLGAYTPATGNAEVVAFDGVTDRMYSLNATGNRIDIVQIGASGSLTEIGAINLAALPGFGSANSVAVAGGISAVAYQNASSTQPGGVALYDAAGALVKVVTVGSLPDQITFTPDGSKLLVANEGEAVSSADNPPGTISIISLAGGAAAAQVVNTISFATLNGAEAALRAKGVAVLSGQPAAADIEPEYIAVSADGTRAYVTLQEVNAVAIIDLTNPAADRPLAILPLGGVDHRLAGNEFDGSDRDGIKLVNAPVTSLLQPDAIATFQAGGSTYFVTANEGDARVAFTDTVRLGSAGYVLDASVPNGAALKSDANLGRLNVLTNRGDTDGDGDFDQIYNSGGRGITIFRQNPDGTVTKVRDTGGEFEKITASLPDAATAFNQNQAPATFDTRSDDKAGEPEGVTIGTIGGRVYAFVALERQGGVMIYDVSDPATASFVGFRAATATDAGPEVVKFVTAAESPTGTDLVLSANEISGTTTVYAALPKGYTQSVDFAPSSLRVTQLEGNAGATNVVFTVERQNGTLGNLTFTAELAGTGATADDFAGGAALPRTITGTIPAGATSTTITVALAGDTARETNEIFSLTLKSAMSDIASIAGAVAATDAAATGIVLNDDTPIYAIQGTGQVSALAGQTVSTIGTVTAVDTNGSRGFYIQDATGDGNTATSDAIFVFTNAAPVVQVGQSVSVTGTVSEFLPSGAAVGSLPSTQITAAAAGIAILGQGAAIAPTIIGGADGRLAPTESFTDGNAFFESLEGMLVTVRQPVATSPTSSFGEIYTVTPNATGGVQATTNGRAGLGDRGALIVTGGTVSFGNTDAVGGDLNPERVQIDDDNGVLPGFVTPLVNVGAKLSDVTGIVNYDFSNFQIVPTQAYTITAPSPLAKETTSLAAGDANHLLVASYNAENLDPGDGQARFNTIAAQILGSLKAPDILALQEVQDNSGPPANGVTGANVTLQTLVDALKAQGGPTYAYLDNPFIGDGTNGGEPGGNIRTAYLYRTDRVAFVADSLATVSATGEAIKSPTGNADQTTNADNPFFQSRPPLAATFTFNGEDVTIINNHFTSKGGSGALYGSTQPAFDAGEVSRSAQAQAVNTYVDKLLSADAKARVIVAGDLNDFDFEQPLSVLKGTATVTNYDVAGADPITATATYTPGGTAILTDLNELLPANQRFDYVFEGNAQSLDHMLASGGLRAGAEFDAVHLNAEFADQTSDHDPLAARFTIMPTNYTLQLLHMSDGEGSTLTGDTAPIMGALIDRFDNQFANTLVLGAGDLMIPGPFLTAGADPALNAVVGGTTALGRPDIAIYNAFGVKASAFGNHEFDLGSAVLQAAYAPSAGWVGAQFPYLSANLDFSGDSAIRGTVVAGGQDVNAIKGKVAPSAVVTINGERIGIVGATTQVLERISSPTGTEVNGFPKAGQTGDNLTEKDDMALLASQLQPVIDALVAQGVNKIVLSTHLQILANEQALAPLLRNVDIILAGGSHTRLGDATDVAGAFPGHDANFAGTYPILTAGADGAPTLIVATDSESTYLGRLVAEFDETGRIVTSSLNPAINGAYASNQATLQSVYGAEIGQAFAAGSIGARVQAITAPVDNIIAVKDGTVFGYTDVYLEGDRVFGRAEETNLGDLSADANAFALATALPAQNFVVSLKNGGGIRASIGSVNDVGGNDPNAGAKLPPAENPEAGKAFGGISQLDAENALRFDNKLMVFDTTPQGLLNILNYGAGLAPGNGGFPQIGGVKFSYDPDFPAGQKILSIALIDEQDHVIARVVENGKIVAGAPATISVVTLNFTANGGDGYPTKANGENFRYLLTDGKLSAAIDEAQDFTTPANVPTNALGELKAFQDYLKAEFATPDTAYATADTPAALDLRIENLNLRADAVFDSGVINGTDGNDTITATKGNDVLLGGQGLDTAVFDFKFLDTKVDYVGTKIFVSGTDGARHEVQGIETFKFTDTTINNADGSPLVDDLFYLSHNKGVFRAGIDADTHFSVFGAKEERDPNAFFDTSSYLDANPGLRASGVNALTHYDTIGFKTDRDPGPNFDTRLYLQNNPSVQAAGIDPLAHFLANGQAEGRTVDAAQGSPITHGGFDAQYYLFNNPGVAKAGIDAWTHFEVFGWKEGRNPNALFDTKGYLAAYKDVADAGINPLTHYDTVGYKQGRDPSANFDTTDYLAKYSGVAAANFDPLVHYLTFGVYEGRSTFADGHLG